MIAKLVGLLRRPQRDRDRGSMAIEFAMAAPVLVTLVLGVADYGSLMNTTASLRGATRSGAEYAKANWNNPSMTNVATSTEQQVCGFLGLPWTGSSCPPVTPGAPNTCTCADGTKPSPLPTCPLPTDANPCASKTDTRVFEYVTVTATQSFSPMFSWASFAFPSILSASTTVRTQ